MTERLMELGVAVLPVPSYGEKNRIPRPGPGDPSRNGRASHPKAAPSFLEPRRRGKRSGGGYSGGNAPSRRSRQGDGDERHFQEPAEPPKLRDRRQGEGVSGPSQAIRRACGRAAGGSGYGSTSEAEPTWTGFLCRRTRRGLRGEKRVVSDAHEGLKAADTKVLSAT